MKTNSFTSQKLHELDENFQVKWPTSLLRLDEVSEQRVEPRSSYTHSDKNWVRKGGFTTPLQVFPGGSQKVASIVTNKGPKRKPVLANAPTSISFEQGGISSSRYYQRVQELGGSPPMCFSPLELPGLEGYLASFGRAHFLKNNKNEKVIKKNYKNQKLHQRS